MKKKSLKKVMTGVTILTLACAMLLTGCGKSGGGSSAKSGGDLSGNVSPNGSTSME